ncbi:hypothetical protein BU16DRAFT_69691 [Lophium mytilinum]|uniref:Aminoglycoside phosphotransferase domain-containing protein n=1 Tax=Lophium mytilinum TaxID=390894 RepID=A0A6A6QQ55_9PEZI|nr:hypothetical protein BU16DRAFT_69691 [Lophium mytilinum]
MASGMFKHVCTKIREKTTRKSAKAPKGNKRKDDSKKPTFIRKALKYLREPYSVSLPIVRKGGEVADFETRYWGPVKKTSHRALIDLARSILDPDNVVLGEGIRVVKESEGSYHKVWILEHFAGQKVAIKVPAIGHAARWMPVDAVNLRSEALTMEYIRLKTKCPVPKVLNFDCTFDNPIGCPYIMMENVEGISAYDAWFPEEEGELPLEEVRENILTSLAGAMAELRHLEFDKIGMLYFDDLNNPTVGDVQTFVEPACDTRHPEDDGIAREQATIPAFKTTKEYYKAELESERLRPGDWRSAAIRKVCRLALDGKPFTTASSRYGIDNQPEKFLLMHPDFNYQNIMVTPDGKQITGIFDWDGVQTVPRCIGYSAVPVWLRQDWQSDYVSPDDHLETHTVDELEKYRKFYAQAMRDAAGEDSDWKYTENSPIACALHSALYGQGNLASFAEKLLIEAFPKSKMQVIMNRLGRGHWELGEDALRERLPRTFGCYNVHSCAHCC